MDRLKALAIFKSVVDQGGFSRAAASMNLSASLVTRSVQELEAHLGVRLLLRTTRTVALTSVGASVFERATGLLASYDELEAFSSQSVREPQGQIRLAAPAAFGRFALGQPLAAFRARWPTVSVDLRLREDMSGSHGDDADLALSFGPVLRSSRVARRLASMEVGLYASTHYLRQHGEPGTPADLARLDGLLNRGHRCTGWSLRHRHTGARETAPVRAVLQSTHDEVLMEAASHDAGIAQLPAFLVDAAPAAARLRRVLPDWSAEPVAVHLSYESRSQALAVRKLIDHLVEWFDAGDTAGDPTEHPVPLHRREPLAATLAA
jgi:DNA-binding transcriptional LysR family regulator